MTRPAFFRRPALISSIFTLVMLIPLLLAGPVPGRAADAATVSHGAHGTQTKPGPPEIYYDAKNGTVRFVIDGRDILTIDADGIQVHGNIRYTGTAAANGEAPAKSPRVSPLTSHDKPR